HTRSKRDWSSDVCSSDLSTCTSRVPCSRGSRWWTPRQEVQNERYPPSDPGFSAGDGSPHLFLLEAGRPAHPRGGDDGSLFGQSRSEERRGGKGGRVRGWS